MAVKPAPSRQGFTLVEILVVVVLVGILALAVTPVLRSQDVTKLDVAVTEVGNVLRFAMSEANRTGGYVLVDASAPGRLRVLNSNVAGAALSPLTDPLTKRSLEVDSAASVFGMGLAISANFRQGGSSFNQLLIGPGVLKAFDSGVERGPLAPGSGVILALGTLNAVVGIDETTGRVTLP